MPLLNGKKRERLWGTLEQFECLSWEIFDKKKCCVPIKKLVLIVIVYCLISVASKSCWIRHSTATGKLVCCYGNKVDDCLFFPLRRALHAVLLSHIKCYEWTQPDNVCDCTEKAKQIFFSHLRRSIRHPYYSKCKICSGCLALWFVEPTFGGETVISASSMIDFLVYESWASKWCEMLRPK